MNFGRVLSLISFFVCVTMLTACNSGSNTPPPADPYAVGEAPATAFGEAEARVEASQTEVKNLEECNDPLVCADKITFAHGEARVRALSLLSQRASVAAKHSNEKGVYKEFLAIADAAEKESRALIKVIEENKKFFKDRNKDLFLNSLRELRVYSVYYAKLNDDKKTYTEEKESDLELTRQEATAGRAIAKLQEALKGKLVIKEKILSDRKDGTYTEEIFQIRFLDAENSRLFKLLVGYVQNEIVRIQDVYKMHDNLKKSLQQASGEADRAGKALLSYNPTAMCIPYCGFNMTYQFDYLNDRVASQADLTSEILVVASLLKQLKDNSEAYTTLKITLSFPEDENGKHFYANRIYHVQVQHVDQPLIEKSLKPTEFLDFLKAEQKVKQ